jgi:hypothetical protein
MVKPDERTLVIAVLGLGEAGSVIARDLLAAGAGVRGYDPAVAAAPGITDTTSEASWRQPTRAAWSGSSTAPSGTHGAEPPRWRPPPTCSPNSACGP